MLKLLALELAVLALIFFFVAAADSRVPFVLLGVAVGAFALEGDGLRITTSR